MNKTSEMLEMDAGQKFDIEGGKLPISCAEHVPKSNKINALRNEACAVLCSAALDGRLSLACKEIKCERQDSRPNHLAELQGRAAAGLARSALDGRLKTVLEESRLESLGCQARELLTRSVDNGQLRAALKENREEKLRSQVREALTRSIGNGQLSSALKESRMETLRSRACELLTSSVDNGQLFNALKESQKESRLEQLRSRVNTTLIQSVHNGQLEHAVTERKVEAVRYQARELLTQSASNGQLSQALKECQLESVRCQARDLLANALSTGQLTKAVKECRLESLRSHVKEVLAKSAHNGQLSDALQENHTDALRTRVRDVFVRSAHNGELYDAVKECSMEPLRIRVMENLTRSARNGQLQNALKECQLESARRHARDILNRSAQTGQLENALEEVKVKSLQVHTDTKESQPKGLESIRSRLLDVFLQSADDGRLEKVLKDAKPISEQQLVSKTADKPIASIQAKEASQLQGIEDARCRVKDVLNRAVLDGRIEDAQVKLLQQPTKAIQPEESKQLPQNSKDVGTLQTNARATFTRAFLDGSLAKCLGEMQVEAKNAHVRNLRQSIRQSLSGAVMDGRLNATLTEEAPRVPVAPYPQTMPSDEKLENTSLADVKERVKSALHSVAVDGRLSSILKNLKLNPSQQPANTGSFSSELAKHTPQENFQQVQSSKNNAAHVDEQSEPVPSNVRTVAEVSHSLIPASPPVPPRPSSRASSKRRPQRRIHHVAEKGEHVHLSEMSSSKGMPEETRKIKSNSGSRPISSSSQSHVDNSLRAAPQSMSAMALDLGEDICGSYTNTFHRLATPPHRQAHGKSTSLGPKHSISSVSKQATLKLPPLVAMGTQGGQNLPTISTKQYSAGAVAWSVQRAKSATRWGGMGIL